MFRLGMITLVLVVLAVPIVAVAEEGRRAKLTMTVSFGDEFFELMEEQAGKDVGLDSRDFEVQPIAGNLYFTKTRLRMDINVGAGIGVMTTITDYDEQMMYMIYHGMQSAFEVDLGDYSKTYEELGLPLANPEQVFYMWDEFYEALKDMPGMKVEDLGEEEVNDLKCHGLQFTGNLEKLLDAEGFAALPGMDVLRNMSGEWSGEFWIAEDFGLPAKMEMTMLGMEFIMDITEVQPWAVTDALLQVPPGYKVVVMSAEDLMGGVPNLDNSGSGE